MSMTPGGSNQKAITEEFDEPYAFGRIPTTAAPAPFNTRQFAKLLIVRSRLRNGQELGLPVFGLGEGWVSS